MKKFCIIAIFAFTLLAGCDRNNVYDKQLYEVENLIDNYPDSALHILKNSISTNTLSKSQYADWCFLFTKSYDKCHKKHKTDSLIRSAVFYYEDNNVKHRLAEAYYYMACASLDIGNELLAQQYFLKTLTDTDTCGQRKILQFTHYNLASIYMNQGVSDMSLSYYEKALHYAKLNNDSLNQSLVCRNIARTYVLRNELDSAVAIYNLALPCSSSSIRASIFNDLGILYTKKQEYAKAYGYFSDCLSQSSPRRTDHVHVSLGNLFLGMDKADSAQYHLTKAMNSNFLSTKAAAYHGLYKLAAKQERWEEALSFLETCNLLSDSVLSSKKSESIRKMEALHNFHKAETEFNEMKLANSVMLEHRYKLILVIVFLVIVVFLLVFIAQWRREQWKKREKLLKEFNEKLKEANTDIIRQNEKRIKELEARVITSNEEQEMTEVEIKKLVLANMQLAHDEYEAALRTERFRLSPIYQKVNDENTVKLTEDDQRILKETIENTFPNFYSMLYMACPQIKEDEVLMCTLYKAEVKPTRKIGEYMNLTGQGVIMKRDRLYFRIFNDKCETKLFDDFIASLQ
ncbi:tetratricopeptide repeat protein [Bacteroides sp. OttesenSCG-928-J23]|nr:tetratricopeptide repeat protein [Bacteroides sp. OttesenSCG-928-J23]MDL2304964.1 tetratricopeptide repeat protein [Bacteroides sp. OttesenSCG-928-D19]